MKLPSLQQVLDDFVQTFLRFPFVLVNAVVGTATVVMLLDHEGPPQSTVLFNILMATVLGIPLLLGLALMSEKRNWSRLWAYAIQVAGIVLLIAYACTIPSDLSQAPAVYIIRQFMLAVALHLFVAFAPYTAAGEYNAFWHYNKILFLRLCTTAIFAVVLYAGLSLALAALDHLFGMNVPMKRYSELWFLIVGLFGTWFFLAGVPRNWADLENSTDYPRGIKIFAQYILFPLVVVYLVILYAYLIKIVVSWNWPQGWVSKLILGFSATGIFSLLLLHPVREKVENIWIRRYSQWFYLVLIPLLFILFPAVWRRISEYGITEGRYIAVILSLWLTGIVIYFLISKIKSIKIIPSSLCVLAFCISCGPWGAFAVSENSQVQRLKTMLIRDSILVDNKIQKAPAEVPKEDVRQISSIISYLYNIHGYDRIQPWFAGRLRTDSTGRSSKYKEPELLAGMMGIEYLNIWYSPEANDLHLGTDQQKLIDITGYSHMIRGRYVSDRQGQKDFSDAGILYRFNASLDTLTFIRTGEDQPGTDSLKIDLRPLIDQLVRDYRNINVVNMDPESLSLSGVTINLKVKVYLRFLNLHREDKKIKIENYSADILY
jgi:hypothetical protein